MKGDTHEREHIYGYGEHFTHAEAQRAQYYSDPVVVATLLRHYAPDYRLLPLRVPQWAVDLVGAEYVRSLGIEATDEELDGLFATVDLDGGGTADVDEIKTAIVSQPRFEPRARPSVGEVCAIDGCGCAGFESRSFGR